MAPKHPDPERKEREAVTDAASDVGFFPTSSDREDDAGEHDEGNDEIETFNAKEIGDTSRQTPKTLGAGRKQTQKRKENQADAKDLIDVFPGICLL